MTQIANNRPRPAVIPRAHANRLNLRYSEPVFTPPAVQPRWNDGRTVIVAAPGPSLTAEVAKRCQGFTVLAVKEAYRVIPWAEVLYGCDAVFWHRNNGCTDFSGERWSSHGSLNSDNKLDCARAYGLKLVHGKPGDTFSLDPAFIHYGSNSGFQAINLAILFGASRIVLVGFDMCVKQGKRYFFGNAPHHRPPGYAKFIPKFNQAARHLPQHIRIVNATPDSALQCFPMKELDDALTDQT